MSQAPQKSRRKHSTLSLLLKIGVTLAALGWVFTQINPQEVWQVLKGANYFMLLAAAIFFILSKVVASLRLNVFFRNHQIRITERENLKLYWLGMFYNIFLPGGVSGDGYKIYLLKKRLKKNLKALFAAVFIDRISGVAALATYAVILLSVARGNDALLRHSWLLSFVVLAGFYIFLRIFFKRYLSIYGAITGYSFLVQGLQVAAVYFILKSFGVTDHMTAYIFVFLVSSIVAIIPVSVGGAGTRELAFLYGARYLHLSPELSVTVSLTFYLITLTVSLYGMVYSIKTPRIEADMPEAKP